MVDYIRSAYTVPMRFFRDDPLSVLTVRWSFVADNTPGMPFAHAFGCRQWDIGEEEEPLIGELDGPRSWRGGTPPYPLPIVGPLGIDNMGLCGAEEQWKNGALTSDPVPPNWLNTAIPQCCKRPPLFARGGVAIGGPGEIGPCCAGVGLPVNLKAIFSNVVGSCPVLEGLQVALFESTFQPPDIPIGTSRYMSNPLSIGGEPVQMFLTCRSDIGLWDLLVMTIGGFAPIWGSMFNSTVECLPFKVEAITGWPNPVGSCNVLFTDLLIIPA